MRNMVRYVIFYHFSKILYQSKKTSHFRKAGLKLLKDGFNSFGRLLNILTHIGWHDFKYHLVPTFGLSIQCQKRFKD